MADRFFPNKSIQNARVVRPVSTKVFGWLAMAALIGSVVCTSFVVSARQHFAAVNAGYHREQLRQQASVLEEQLKRLQLQRAEAASPLELEKRAERAGMHRPGATSGRIRRPAQLGRGEQ